MIFNWRQWDEVGDFSYRQYYNDIIGRAKDLPGSKRRDIYRHYIENDTFFLLRYIMGPKETGNLWADIPYVFCRCQEVDESDKNTRMNNAIFLWFRGGFKSTIVTVAKSIQRILRDPNSARLITSHNAVKAKDFLAGIAKELESNELLKAYYPDILYDNPSKQTRWSIDRGIFVKRSTNRPEATVSACSILDLPTGGHYTEITHDDTVTEESVTTEDQKRKTFEHIQSAFNLGTTMSLPGVQPTTHTFVGTRYDAGDAYGRLEDQKIYNISKQVWHTGDKGTPRAHTRDAIKELKQRLSSYIFACQYELNPTEGSRHVFRTPLTYYDKASDEWENIILVDPAGDGKRSRDHDPDNTAMAVIGLDPLGAKFFREGVLDKIPLMDRIRLLFDLIRRYRVRRVFYEKVGMQSDIHVIETFKIRTGLQGFEIIEFNPKQYGAKNDRIERGLMPEIENRTLKFPTAFIYTNSDGELVNLIQAMQKEMSDFPSGKHDDMIDCLSQLIALPKHGYMEPIHTNEMINTHRPRQKKSGERRGGMICI